MGILSVIQVTVQLIICIKLITSQTSTTFRPVQTDATIVGVEPFYNQTTYSLTECYLACHQQIERCFYIEVANVSETWSCKLFHFFTEDIKKQLKSLKGSVIAASPYIKYPTDCEELKQAGIKEDGVYSIFTGKLYLIKVYCEMSTDGGGWIVIQKRFDGSVDFNRNWNDYKNGFGDINGEYWLGNEFVHQYTEKYQTEMKIEAVAFDGENATLVLQKFTLSDEASKYIFDYNTCQGLCSDLEVNKGKRFTTCDQDNDEKDSGNCAVQYNGGWWFEGCYWIYLNGRYSNEETVGPESAIHWAGFRGYAKSLKKTKIMIRRTQ